MSLERVAVERRAPREEDGLGGGWFVTCSFAGRSWRFRMYGHDWVFPRAEDAAAWKTLTPEQRKQLREGVIAALESVQRARIHRQNHERRFRSGMRLQTMLALRDKQQAPSVEHTPQPQGNRARESRRNVRIVSARGDPDSSEPPPRALTATAPTSESMRRRVLAPVEREGDGVTRAGTGMGDAQVMCDAVALARAAQSRDTKTFASLCKKYGLAGRQVTLVHFLGVTLAAYPDTDKLEAFALHLLNRGGE